MLKTQIDQYHGRSYWSRASILLALTVLLAGCSSLSALLPGAGSPPANNTSERYSDIEVIAADLVNALMQVNDKHPQNTVIRMDRPVSTFGTALKAVLENAGYGLRIGSGDVQGDALYYSVKPKTSEADGRHYTYFISVGDVKMKRDYFVQERGVTPSSNLFVIGTDPSAIRLNDSIFDAPTFGPPAGSTPPAPPVDVASTAPVTISPVPQKEEAIRVETPVQAIGDDDIQVVVVTEPAQPVAVPESANDESVFGSKTGGKQRQNMYEIRESNYAEFLADYSEVYKEVLIFPNDSMRLGESNKSKIKSIANRMIEDSDVVSVIGCSHGRTSLENGNAVLATGRAQRVKEAFLIAGVQEPKILEEGCWSAEYFDEVMPRRGVVVSIKREARNS